MILCVFTVIGIQFHKHPPPHTHTEIKVPSFMEIQNKLDSFVFRMWIIYYVCDSLNMNVC